MALRETWRVILRKLLMQLFYHVWQTSESASWMCSLCDRCVSRKKQSLHECSLGIVTHRYIYNFWIPIKMKYKTLGFRYGGLLARRHVMTPLDVSDKESIIFQRAVIQPIQEQISGRKACKFFTHGRKFGWGCWFQSCSGAAKVKAIHSFKDIEQTA